MESFWGKLPRPFFILAPMEDVTDVAFRALVAQQEKKPDVFFTEFTSADGLALAPDEGRRALLQKLKYSPAERPIVAQFFTSKPDHMEKAAALASELGFDGVDINMGCPDAQVERQKCGASLIKNPPLARELIRAARRGAPDLPISVKTRIGYTKDELDTWLTELLAEKPAAIAIHARTRKEMSDVPAHWDAIARAVTMRDTLSPDTLIVGNGDVQTLEEGRVRIKETGCDGVMIGRAAIANPWLWSEYAPSREERLVMVRRHAELAQEHFGPTASGGVRKHIAKFAIGFPGAKELRVAMNKAKSAQDLIECIDMKIADAPFPQEVVASLKREE